MIQNAAVWLSFVFREQNSFYSLVLLIEIAIFPLPTKVILKSDTD